MQIMPFRLWALGLTALLPPLLLQAAPPIYKCTSNGAVTLQATPCPVGTPGKAPTVAQLNADRQKRLQEAGHSSDDPSTALQKGQFAIGSASAIGATKPGDASRPAPTESKPAPASFHCDGRQYCSQMSSCAEAKSFLRHCPSVKMDGDFDGIPCEDHWCRGQ